MTAADNFHSRLVGWTKIILPLMALALLSTLFLFAKSSNDGTEIPFARLTELARDQRISEPEFSGVAGDGSIIKIAAQSAQPQEGNLDFLLVTDPTLNLDAIDGSSLRINAGEGIVNGLTKQAKLTGLARLETSSGYLMETEGLLANLETGVVTSFGPLEIHAPFGQVTAGHVEIRIGQDNSGQQMYFSEGVRMLYVPQKKP